MMVLIDICSVKKDSALFTSSSALFPLWRGQFLVFIKGAR